MRTKRNLTAATEYNIVINIWSLSGSHNIPPLLCVSYTQTSNKNTINNKIEIILVKNVNCECVRTYTFTKASGCSKKYNGIRNN